MSDKISFRLSESGEIISDQIDRFFRMRLPAGQAGIGSETLIASSRGFFQNNLGVTRLLIEQVEEWTEAIAPENFFDLYAGVGMFSILCAKNCTRILAVEENRVNIEAMRMNREERKLSPMRIVEGRVESLLPALLKENPGRSLLFLDPPRQGLARALAQMFSTLQGVEALLYVSCDIATLARDLAVIIRGGRWIVKEIVLFDMFPRTRHVEAAVRMENRNPL